MKILVPKNPVMDSSVRKQQLPTSRFTKPLELPDPYVFSEPESFPTSHGHGHSGGKNIKLIAPKPNSKLPHHHHHHHKTSKSKCPQKKKTTLSLLEKNTVEPRNSAKAEWKRKHLENLKRLKVRSQKRDHALLYYPRAGDEICDSELSEDETPPTHQQHWFSDDIDAASLLRSARLQLVRSQLQRQLIQLQTDDKQARARLKEKAHILVEAALQDPTATARVLNNAEEADKTTDGPLVVGGPCQAEGCKQTSLPCTQHCSNHIMLNMDQLLFEHCTAKFSDNTQCSVPVFDVAHELPLCPEHARKRDNYHRRSLESKPKKPRKKPPSPSSSAPKPKSKYKSKKKKKTLPEPRLEEIKLPDLILPDENQFVHEDDSHNKTLNNLNISQASSTSLNSLAGLELGPLGLNALKEEEVFEVLDPNEHDFGNVLNNLPADAFNDLFIERGNGEYEPSREEEEELERALEAVNKDVRNLERINQSHGLLEPALLAQIMSDIAS